MVDDTDVPDDFANLFVLNLPDDEDQIKEIFKEAGTISNMRLLPKKEDQETRAAMITMSSHKEARAALQQLSRKRIDGIERPLRVTWDSRSLEKRNGDGGGQRSGGFGGSGFGGNNASSGFGGGGGGGGNFGSSGGGAGSFGASTNGFGGGRKVEAAVDGETVTINGRETLPMKSLVNGQEVVVGYFFKDITSGGTAAPSASAPPAEPNSNGISRRPASTQNGFRKVTSDTETSQKEPEEKRPLIDDGKDILPDPNYVPPIGYFAGNRRKTVDAHVSSKDRTVETAREPSTPRARITGPTEDAAIAAAKATVSAEAAAAPSQPAVKAEPVVPASPAAASSSEMTNGTGRGVRSMRRGASVTPSVPTSPEKSKATIQPIMALQDGRLVNPVTTAPAKVGESIAIAMRDFMPSDCSITVWTAIVDEKESTRTFPSTAVAAKMSSDLKAFYDGVTEKIGTPTAGQPVAVLQSSVWHRGKFLEMVDGQLSVFFVDIGEIHSVDSGVVRALDQRFGQVPCASVVAKIYGTPKDLKQDQKELIGEWMKTGYNEEDVIFVDVMAIEPHVELRLVLKETTVPLLLKKKELEAQKKNVKAGTVLLAEGGAVAMFLLDNEKAQALADLQQQVQELAAKAPVPTTLPTISANDDTPFAVLFDADNTFYRAAVFQTKEQEGTDEYSAELTDYGNAFVVKKDKLRVLPAKMFEKLDYTDVIRINGLSEEQRRDKAVTEKLQPLQNQCCLYEIVVPPTADCHQATANLWDQDGVPQPKDFLEQDVQVPTTSSMSQKPYKHMVMDLKDKVEIKEGAVLDVHTSMVTDPELMFLSLGKEPVLDARLQALSASLDAECPTLPPLQKVPPRSAVVAAQYSEDKQWYRAVIIEVIDEKKANVLYLDYGNSEDVSAENMREMKDEWMAVPKMVVQAMLSGIKPLSSDGDYYGEAAIASAGEMLQNKPAKFTVQKALDDFGFGGSLQLDGETKTVSEMMVEANIARAKKRSGSQ